MTYKVFIYIYYIYIYIYVYIYIYIYKIYANDLYEAKYQHLINIHEKAGLDHLNDPRTFIEYSNNMQDVYKKIENYNPNKKRKVLILFDDMIADMINNKK